MPEAEGAAIAPGSDFELGFAPVVISAFVHSSGAMGLDNDLPWKRALKGDMHFLRILTTRQQHTAAVIMGRRTFESIRGPLPGRVSIVLTSKPQKSPSSSLLFMSTLDAAIEHAQQNSLCPVIFGGASVYEEALSKHKCRLFITVVFAEFEGDTHFPVSLIRKDLEEGRNISEEVNKLLLACGVKQTWALQSGMFVEGGVKYAFFAAGLPATK